MRQFSKSRLQLTIPVAGIHTDPRTGFDAAVVDGRETQVMFDLDEDAWRAVETDGGLSAPLRGLANTSRTRLIELPAFPSPPEDALEIPRFLHVVWVGHGEMPEPLARRVVLNALRTPGFRTIVHADMASTSLLDALRKRLTSEVPWITVLNLREEPCFPGFAMHAVYRYYRAFMGEEAPNYGAASDLLRLWLVYAYGGIYLDVDDVFAHEIPPDACPKADAGDLLLGSNFSVPQYEFSGCCQSHFASQVGNGLLMRMLDEASVRMAGSSIFSRARPWRIEGQSDSGELNAYIREVLRLTGPQLFTDLLAAHYPGMLELEGDLLAAMEVLHYTPDRPRYRADGYLATAAASLAHYRPFRSAPFLVEVGSAGSWLAPPSADAPA
jgi:glycosyl transferase-like sugar-binding protein